jgi:hypothetical protein
LQSGCIVRPACSASADLGVGQFPNEPQSLSDVRSTDARSRDTGRCEGVTDSFHVSLNKVEPTVPNCCFNLFTKDDRRVSLVNEFEERRPQMAFVSCAGSGAGDAKGLART